MSFEFWFVAFAATFVAGALAGMWLLSVMLKTELRKRGYDDRP